MCDQSRPLPDPRSSGSFAEQFHSVASEVDRTLVDSQQQENNRDDDEEHTLAESIVDSMHRYAHNNHFLLFLEVSIKNELRYKL